MLLLFLQSCSKKCTDELPYCDGSTLHYCNEVDVLYQEFEADSLDCNDLDPDGVCETQGELVGGATSERKFCDSSQNGGRCGPTGHLEACNYLVCSGNVCQGFWQTWEQCSRGCNPGDDVRDAECIE